MYIRWNNYADVKLFWWIFKIFCILNKYWPTPHINFVIQWKLTPQNSIYSHNHSNALGLFLNIFHLCWIKFLVKDHVCLKSLSHLNRDIQRLSKWAATWFMSFNPVKTKFMVISNNHQENYPVLTMNGTNLERVQTYLPPPPPQLVYRNHIDESVKPARTLG